MKRLLLSLFLLAPTVSHSADTDGKTLSVFIFAGQSNMVGTHSQVADIKKPSIISKPSIFPRIVKLGELLARSYLEHR